MYIVIPITATGAYDGIARLMPKETYEKVCKCFRVGRPALHIVDIDKINEYPSEVFADKDVKRYVSKLKKKEK